MKINMGTARHRALLMIGAALVLVSCVGGRQGVAWPALDQTVIGGSSHILVAYEGQIEAVDPANGARVRLLDADGQIRQDEEGNPRLWLVNGGDIDGATFFAAPAVVGDNLFFPAVNNRLLEVEADTARVTSTAGIALPDQVIAGVTVDDTSFYVPLKARNVVAVDKASGDIRWTAETVEGVWSAPVLADGVLYFGALDHNLYAVDSQTGEQLWTVDLEGGIAASPLIYDGRLFVGSFSQRMYEVSLDGEILSEYDGENWFWNTPVIRDDVLYTADLGGNVYALDVTDGLSALWSVKPAERGIRAAPIVSDDHVVVATRNGRLFWLDRQSGALVLDRTIEGEPEILSDMLLLEPGESLDLPEARIIVATVDAGKLLVAFNLENGIEIWKYAR